MLVGLLTVPIVALFIIKPGALSDTLADTLKGTGVSVSSFLNPLKNGDKNLSFVEIISQLAW